MREEIANRNTQKSGEDYLKVELAQQGAASGQAPTRVLVCHDARMGEVYWAGFDAVGGFARAATAEAVARPEALLEAALAWINTLPTCAAGSGFAAYPALSASLAMLAPTLAELRPRALEVASLAAHDGLARAVPPEQALPVYVRNNVAVAPNQVGGGQAQSVARSVDCGAPKYWLK